MDPDVLLARIRTLAERVVEADGDDADDGDNPAVELSASILDLDIWLSRGGFLPSDWARTSSGAPVG